MTEEQREIRRKKRVLEYAERVGNNNIACRRFGIARSTFYVWRERYRELGEAGLARRRPRTHNHPNKTPDCTSANQLGQRPPFAKRQFLVSG